MGKEEVNKSIQHALADGTWPVFPWVVTLVGSCCMVGVKGRALTTVLHMCCSSGFVALLGRGSNPPAS